MPTFNINTNAAVVFANKLERMHRSGLPVAVRNALNSAAFDVKKNTMPASAKKNFIERKPTFFKANSKVDQAKGFDLNKMEATVGFVKLSGKGNTVEDLEQQESGGGIEGRSFIPLKQSRSGNSWNKNVRLKDRITQLNGKILNSKNANGRNERQKFIKSAIYAGKGGVVIGDRTNASGNRILWGIRSIKRIKRNTVIKSVPLFAVKANRVVKVKATEFMQSASEKSAKKMESFFVDAAKKQIERLSK